MIWCTEYGFNPILPNISITDRNQVIALYTLSLAQGNTLLFQPIKAEIISYYSYTAALLSTNVHLMNPRLNAISKIAAPITKVLNE